jgi:hypothetical protein
MILFVKRTKDAGIMDLTSDLCVVVLPVQEVVYSSLVAEDLGQTLVVQSNVSYEAQPESGALNVARRPRPPKLYRMAEVVAYSGLSRQTVHNYTSMGLLREAERTGGGHRLYEESVFQRLDDVAEMRKKGKSIQEIREHFVPKGGAET